MEDFPITPKILLNAYAAGIFPMAETSTDSALYWVEPETRGILPLHKFHVSRSLRKIVRQQPFDIRIDQAFSDVIAGCAEAAPGRTTTWINDRIRDLYANVHKMGNAHSIECWQDDKLVGGLYGIKLGAAFFGESMFSRVSNASKVALVHLVARLNAGGFALLDAQFTNEHLEQFGCVGISRDEYKDTLELALRKKGDFRKFDGDADPEKVLRFACY